MNARPTFLSIFFLTLALSGAADAAEPIDAATIYAESCSVCHGDDGRGAVWGQASLSVPPRNFRTAESRSELTRERMIASVVAGRPGTPMPGFGTQLDLQQISAVVDYIHENFMTPPENANPDVPGLPGNTAYGPIGGSAQKAAPARGDFDGDAARGAILYAANCVDCHGANGGGDGPRAYFIFPKPRNFHDPATREYLDRGNLFNGIKFGVVGKEMPAWGKVWSDEQIADVAEYVYRQFLTPSR